MPLTQVDQGLLGTNAQYTGFKNRIINGAMMIDQRNAGASVSVQTSTGYALDRWRVYASQNSKYSVQQSTTVPNGFKNSLLVTSSSAYTIGAGETFAVAQFIEGFNTSDLGWGSANASSITLSFWVRSSLTGTFGGSLNNNGYTRSYPFAYTINSANTWEQKTITIAGDVTGTWTTDNTSGIRVWFSLGVGSTYSGTAGAWAGVEYESATGATSVVGTNGATFYITGVQLEKGSTATSFDFRSYGTELALCQRYFVTTYPDGTAVGSATGTGAIYVNAPATTTYLSFAWSLPVKMRATPTATAYSPVTGTSGRFYTNSPAGDYVPAASGSTGQLSVSFTTGTQSINATAYVVAQMTASAEL